MKKFILMIFTIFIFLYIFFNTFGCRPKRGGTEPMTPTLSPTVTHTETFNPFSTATNTATFTSTATPTQTPEIFVYWAYIDQYAYTTIASVKLREDVWNGSPLINATVVINGTALNEPTPGDYSYTWTGNYFAEGEAVGLTINSYAGMAYSYINAGERVQITNPTDNNQSYSASSNFTSQWIYPGTTPSFVYLQIFDYNNQTTVYVNEKIAGTITSKLIPSGTFSPGTQVASYIYTSRTANIIGVTTDSSDFEFYCSDMKVMGITP
jgi:hypothetical protein